MAIRNDLDVARRARDQQRKTSAKPRTGIPGHAWTTERAGLTDIADILLAVLASVEAQRTGKAKKPKTMPRPVDAFQRLDRADAFERHRERVRALCPQGR